MSITPFKIDIPREEVDRLLRKLRDTRVPQDPIVPEAGDDYGPSMEWIHRLYNKWVNDFDWTKQQAHLNRHPHFLARISDSSHTLTIHFTHTRSPRPDAIPLIMIHGWPGSFAEFDRVVDAFANPENPNDPAFHVVVPSLPGFCWSSPPPRRGWTMQDNARVLHELMLTLGYTRYTAQAGDWGSFVAREMGARYAKWCRAVHFNFCPVKPPAGEDDDETTRTERERFIDARAQSWLDDHLGYAVCMRSRPHTIGVALADNPVGILMWVGEKYLEAATPEHAAEPSWDEAVLMQAALYYFSGCIMSSMLPYYEGVKHAEFGPFFLRPENRVTVPMGYTLFLYDTRPSYEKAVEPTGNLVFYNEHDDGGHFAALECPEVLLRDCRTFFGRWFEAGHAEQASNTSGTD